MEQMHANQGLCDSTIWIPKRTNVLSLKNNHLCLCPPTRFYYFIIYYFIIFLCLCCKDIVRLTKSINTVGTNFLGDVFPNLN